MRKFIFFCIAVMLMSFKAVYAEESCITCDTQVNGEDITISGQISNVTGRNQVTLLVGEPDNILYINQAESSENGQFSFNFKMKENTPEGNYNFKIGTDAQAETYTGVLNYDSSLITVRNKFVEAELDINIRAYVPVVSGTISCTDGKEIRLNVINKSDNTVISNDTITSEDGIFNLSYTLPSLLNPKKYDVSLICVDENDSVLANMTVEIDSAILSLAINGTASTAENVDIEAQLRTVNTGLVDNSTTFTGSKTVSVTIPNILASSSFHLSAQGYETITIDTEEPEEDYSVCTIDTQSDNEVIVLAIGNNISSFEGKTYEIIYDVQKVQPIGLYGRYPGSILKLGDYGRIKILSNEDGRMVFEVIDTKVTQGKYWSGIINIFKFRNISGNKISSEIQFKSL